MNRITIYAVRTLLLMLLPVALHAQAVWQDVSPGSAAGLTGTYFLDSKHGYAVGDAGTLLATADGGESWQQITIPTQKGLWGVYAVPGASGTIIYVAGDDGTVMKSTDGGASWNAQDVKYSEGFTFGIFGYDANNLYVTGGEGTPGSTTGVIVTTHDGGATWTKSTISGTYSFDKVFFASPMVGYAVASTKSDFNGGAIYKTTDGGTTWALSKTTPAAVNSAYCFSESNCIAVGFFGVALRTTDGGTSWTPLDLPPASASGSFTHVVFLDPMNGYMANAFGGMVKTSDGGATWQDDDSYPGTGTIWSMAVGNGEAERAMFAVGDAGVVYRLTLPKSSSASAAASATSGELHAALAPNPLAGAGHITVTLPQSGPLDITLYNLRGERIRTLFNGQSEAGTRAIPVETAALPNGMYYCTVRQGGRTVVVDVNVEK